jgi:SAM-dependent methyltransferase
VSTPEAYFDRMYAGAPDPWDFAGRWYEQRKRELTVAALPRRRYRSAFEPGCATGELTALLAARCDRLLAGDRVPAAVDGAAARLAGHPHVAVRRLRVPDEWPPGRFDLIVVSELGYYLDDAGLRQLLDRTVRALEPGGTLVAVHWRWPVADHARDGDDVNAAVDARAELARIARHEEADFRLDVYLRTPPPARSVAQGEGLC